MKKISFVIPCYRSEKTIEKVINEILETVALREEYDYEVICINDCSPDNVYEVLKNLAAQNHKIKVINFAQNRGKHAAVLAGYSFANGDYIVNLDDDFQSPGCNLWQLLDPLIGDGYDFVTARYKRKEQAAWKNMGSAVNNLMSQIMLGKPRGLRFENFFAMKRFVKDEISKYTNPYPYLEGLILRVTHNICSVEMEERGRADDNATGYTFTKSLALWINGFTAFSVKPLRFATFAGGVAAVIGFVYGIIMIIRKLLGLNVVLGYTSLVVIQLFLGGMILMCLGLVGEYVGRIYICLNKSPQYVVRDTINITEEK